MDTVVTETPDEMSARHKKEFKALDGEKRAAIRNAKSSRSKTAKSILRDIEFKYEGMARDLKERQNRELDQRMSGDGDGNDEDGTTGKVHTKDDGPAKDVDASRSPSLEEQPTNEQIEEIKRQKAIKKKSRKRNARRKKDIDREKRINEENASAGPSRRQVEIDSLTELYLHPQKLEMQEVEADGNCLFRAVAMQCCRLGLSDGAFHSDKSYVNIREICANVLIGPNRGEYEPFAEFGEGHASNGNDERNHPATYEEYVNNIRSHSKCTWGGQLELRALSEGLKCPIVVFSADGPTLTMGEEYAQSSDDNDWGKKKVMLLSFHRHYYALGEHYNSIIPQN